MMPVLFTVGPIVVYTAHIFYVLAFLVYSFVFWRLLRDRGILEERIFDLTFYPVVIGIVVARLGYVLLFPQLFEASLLLIGAFWVQSGMWVMAGVVGFILAQYIYCQRVRLTFSEVYDASIVALLYALLVTQIGIFLGGHGQGAATSFWTGLQYTGSDIYRHPVELYTLGFLGVLLGVRLLLKQRKIGKNQPSGITGAVLALVVTMVFFILEFIKTSSVYLFDVSIDQWVLVVIFAEHAGVLLLAKKSQRLPTKKGGKWYDPFISIIYRTTAQKTVGNAEDTHSGKK